jgi:hypothetical protein
MSEMLPTEKDLPASSPVHPRGRALKPHCIAIGNANVANNVLNVYATRAASKCSRRRDPTTIRTVRTLVVRRPHAALNNFSRVI